MISIFNRCELTVCPTLEQSQKTVSYTHLDVYKRQGRVRR